MSIKRIVLDILNPHKPKALVNGSAPLIFSLPILIPLWLSNASNPRSASPLYVAIVIALLPIFLLGIFLGRIVGISRLRGEFQSLAVAVLTAALIYLLAGY